MALGEVISRLSVQLSLDSAAFTKGSATAAKQTKDLGDRMEAMGHKVGTAIKGVAAAGVAMAGAWAVDQVKQMATVGLELASSLGEQAQQMGVTTSALQQYRYIATQVGIEQEEMDKGLTFLTKRLGAMSTATAKQNSEMERFGFTTAEIQRLSKMTAEEALPVLADKYASLTSITEKTALAQEFFGGKLGPKFNTLLAEGSVGIDKLTNAYKALGIEISEGQIAKADEAMDKMAQMQTVMAAKQAQIAADNSEGLMQGVAAWEEFKIKLLDVFGKLSVGFGDIGGKFDEFNKWADDFDRRMGIASPDEFVASIPRHFAESWGRIEQFFTDLKNFTIEAPKWISSMVSQISSLITGKLNSIWDGAKARIEIVKQAFFGLYDAVVGHSYIPDMVDGIADNMARLDSVMVNPAKTATERTKQAFEKLGQDVDGIMRELFPEAASTAGFNMDRDALNAGIAAGGVKGYSVEQLQDALKALQNKEFEEAFKGFEVAANDNADAIEIANVRIVDSFKDTAEKSISVLQGLASAIKGGGFLDILGAVINVGLQLGSIGAFGKGIQTNINAHANGTNFAPGGLSLVGERGPELVNLPRGSKVTPNNKLGGGGNVYNINGVITTDEFWGIIQKGNANAAVGGANLAGMSMARSRKWALG
jgi:hypothetical protein